MTRRDQFSATAGWAERLVRPYRMISDLASHERDEVRQVLAETLAGDVLPALIISDGRGRVLTNGRLRFFIGLRDAQVLARQDERDR